jgi:hypothetical protein
MEKPRRDFRYLIDRTQENSFVCVRRFVKTADLAHELKRRGSNLFGSDRRIEIKKGLDIPAHSLLPQVLRIPKAGLKTMLPQPLS